MFEMKIARHVSGSIVAELKRAWDAGGWVVGAFEIIDPVTHRPVRELEGEPNDFVFRMMFARPHKKQQLSSKVIISSLESRQQAEEFELPDSVTIEHLSSWRMPKTSTPLLVRMPTRARPAQAIEVLEKYRNMAMGPVAIEVIIDEDDILCNDTQFLQRIADLDCVVTVARHANKIAACNAGRVDDWSILVLASDDMHPIVRGYDLKIMSAMEKHFPLNDGSLCFNDGYNRDHVRPGDVVTCTLPVLGRHLYEDYGRIVYHPEYRSIYCDTDQTYLFTRMNRMVFIDEILIEHRHHAAGKARFDELYQFNTRHDDHDHALFEKRRLRNFDAPNLVLSILICSIPDRRKQLERLVDYLRWQSRLFPSTVEICVDLSMDITVGEKRQKLLERACGQYVAFCDDDDWVDSRYVSRVLKACAEAKDCASLTGVVTTDGERPEAFEHSIKYERWETVDGKHLRCPNHLNVVRRDLALKVGFVAKNVGEDHAFSDKLRPLLTSEADTGTTPPLYLYWAIPQKSVQRTS